MAFIPQNPDGTFPLWKGIAAGMSAGAIGQFFGESFPVWFVCMLNMLVGIAASPTDLVKVQLQLDGKLIAAGKEPRCCVVVVPSTLYNPNRLAVFVRYKGTIDAFRTIASQGGVKGLWKGWVPNCQRAALVQIGDLTTYDAAKQFILRNTSVQVCLVLRLHCTQAVFTSL